MNTWEYVFRGQIPLSLNNAYPTVMVHGKGGQMFPKRVKSDALKELRSRLSSAMMHQDLHRGRPPSSDFYLTTWLFFYPKHDSLSEKDRRALGGRKDGFFFKTTGGVQKKDLSDMFKAVEDTFFDYLGGVQDDTQVITLAGYKRLVPAEIKKPLMVLMVSPASLDDPIFHGGEPIYAGKWFTDADNL